MFSITHKKIKVNILVSLLLFTCSLFIGQVNSKEINGLDIMQVENIISLSATAQNDIFVVDEATLGNSGFLTLAKNKTKSCRRNSECPIQKPHLNCKGRNCFCTERCGNSCRRSSDCPIQLPYLICKEGSCYCTSRCGRR